MRKGGQKQKGNRHQSAVGKIFTKAYYPDITGEFRNTPGSGGWDKRIAPGDIQPFFFKHFSHKHMTLDSSFPFSVECKDWKDENVKHIFSGLYSKPSQIYDWLEQSMNDASASGKVALVVFKLYRTENVALMHYASWFKLGAIHGKFPELIYKVSGGPHSIVFVSLLHFVEWIDWEYYKKGGKSI